MKRLREEAARPFLYEERMVADIALLISHGHRESEIGNYAYDKFKLYVRAVSAVRATAQLGMTESVSLAIATVLGSENRTVEKRIAEIGNVSDMKGP